MVFVIWEIKEMMILPKFETSMNEPLENYVGDCPQEEISNSEPGKRLKIEKFINVNRICIHEKNWKPKSDLNFELANCNLPSCSKRFRQARKQH